MIHYQTESIFLLKLDFSFFRRSHAFDGPAPEKLDFKMSHIDERFNYLIGRHTCNFLQWGGLETMTNWTIIWLEDIPAAVFFVFNVWCQWYRVYILITHIWQRVSAEQDNLISFDDDNDCNYLRKQQSGQSTIFWWTITSINNDNFLFID